MVVELVQGRKLIGASATVSGQARSKIGCAVGSVGSSVKSDLEVDQEASSMEPGNEVACGTKGKEIEVRQEVILVCNQAGGEWRCSDPEYAYLMGEKSMVWCTSHGEEKHIWCGSFQVRNMVATWLMNQKIVVLDRHTKLKGGD
ncbi:hypothetical protein IGI04_006993 [Brassica rapa subsp. trilocularis]|uniref:Uncharacterized protein n=1 Tax=Brassica rapa subsp. trilocularis TaxID=1813537 RepID=A0ABQ7NII6_BRACM|nr:hypothetical protein IGI04_006993 [Brassica rapa subsp. trilocularis]